MSKKFTKIVALFLILAMLCTGCGLSGAPADSGASDPAAADDPEVNTDSGDGSAEVKVGLEQNVYEIPAYTHAGPGVKVLRLSVSMGAGDYGTSASGVMFKTFVDRIEELSGGKMLAQVYPASQLASTTDDIVNGILTGAFEMAEVGTGNWGGSRPPRRGLYVSWYAHDHKQHPGDSQPRRSEGAEDSRAERSHTAGAVRGAGRLHDDRVLL